MLNYQSSCTRALRYVLNNKKIIVFVCMPDYSRENMSVSREMAPLTMYDSRTVYTFQVC